MKSSKVLIDNINGHKIEFIWNLGQFDEWKIFHTTPEGKQYPPLDVQYFSFFKKLSNEYSPEVVYNDFVYFYEVTSTYVSKTVLEIINELSKKYKNSEEVRINFTIIYAGMIAEENKERTKLGKRIKRLGMYQLLIDDFKPEEAANFSRGKKSKELNLIMKSKNF